jgi:hypothetical protein
MSPLGVIAMGYKAAKRKGEYLNFDTTEFADNIAEQALAWTVTGLIYAWAYGDDDDDDPKISGAGVQGSLAGAAKGSFERNQSLPPTSIKIGNKAFDYSRIEPMSTTLLPIVHALKAFRDAKNGRQAAENLSEAWVRTAMGLTDKVFFGTIIDIARAIEDPDGFTRWSSNFASSFMPNVFRSGARSLDPYERETAYTGKKGTAERFASAAERGVQQTIPIPAVTGALKRVDIWGQEQTKSAVSPATDTLYKLARIAGAKIRVIGDSQANNLNRMILNWNNKERYNTPGYNEWWPDSVQKYVTLNNRQYYLSDEEYHDMAKTAGEMALSLAKNAKFNYDDPTVYDIARLKAIFSTARRVASARMLPRVLKRVGEENR